MPPVKSLLNKFVAFTIMLLFLAIITVSLHLMITNWWICASLALIYAPFILITFVLYKYTRMRGPISYIGRRIFLTIYNFTIYRRRFLWEQLYDVLCWLIPSTEWKYMNWGYASLSSDGVLINNLAHEDENERFSVQLYHYVATAMESWEDLEGKTILEVSSGRGGGLDYISRYLKAERCIGVDISPVQIEYCKKIYKENPKLAFLKGESEKLSKIEELIKEDIDIVINVESGHCYSNFKKFIQEVEKVLKPGGVFAYSDFRPTHEWPDIEQELESSELKIIKKENISENVIHSLKLDEDRKWKLIQNKLGPGKFSSVLRFFFKQIGGVKGSHIYEGLNQKTMASMAYVLKKPEDSSLI